MPRNCILFEIAKVSMRLVIMTIRSATTNHHPSDHHLDTTPIPQKKSAHSQSNMSAIIHRASSRPSSVLRLAVKTSRVSPGCSRAIHQRIAPTTLTILGISSRPRIGSSSLEPKFQPHAGIGAVRSIFIQTEHTPNSDVSRRPHRITISY